MIEPLSLQKKVEVLLNTIIYPMLVHFPKAEKFAICQEIKQSCYRMIRESIQYQTALKRDKLYYLKQIDAELKYLLVLTSVSRDQKYITQKKAEQLQDSIAEIGRITGGLMKTA